MTAKRLGLGLAALAILLPSAALAQQKRLPTIPPANYDAEQKAAAESFLAARKEPVFGPFEPLMHSPRVAVPTRMLGDYLRFGSAIGTTLSEFEILLISREWSQNYEWSFHAPIALQRGISQAKIDDIAAGRRPAGMSADETIVYEFVTELLKTKHVSDPVYAKAQARYGDKGVMDIVGLCGYYSFQAMTLNVAQTAPVPGQPTLPLAKK